MTKFKRLLSILLVVVILFTTVISTKMIIHASLLPIKEIEAQFLLYELEGMVDYKNVPLKVILGLLMDKDGNYMSIFTEESTMAWQYIKDSKDNLESYKPYVIDENPTLDLTQPEGVTSYTIELIVGNGGPLNTENVRYIITIYLSSELSDMVTYELYTQTSNGERNKVIPKDVIVNSNRIYLVPEHIKGTEYYLGINSKMDNHPYIKMNIYLITMSGNQTDITDQILNKDMTKRDVGYKSTLDKVTVDTIMDTKCFRVVLTNTTDGSVLYDSVEIIEVATDTAYVEGEMFIYNSEKKEDVAIWESNDVYLTIGQYINGVHEKQYMLKEGYSSDYEYYYALNAHSPIWEDDANKYVAKAVVGLCESWDEAAGLEDIQDQLIPEQNKKTDQIYGYKANYSKQDGGQYFTVFFKKVGYEDAVEFTNDNVDVWRFKVSVFEYNPQFDHEYLREFTEKPIIGEADPWFRVTGAADDNGNEYDTYVIENGKNINMDTYYGYGYQTIFINNVSADLSNLKPVFWYANTNSVYAVSKDTGDKVEEGHTRNFKEENQQYTGVIIDKEGNENDRNYWVTFKQLNNSGAELFVYGPNEREVILDEYFEFKHDILIANIGNKPLEDISVELLDAENVKIDPYWTIGGDSNNTLAAFTNTSTDTQYGELANIAKIRLLPDGDGEVKGKLIIRAKDQDPVMIALNGTAQNPEIITEELDDAVKYVPYQHIIATNNMHDWVETKFSVSEGDLPAGIALNSETGEIYGVPTVPDGDTEITYTFTVEAKYLVEGQEGYFDASYKEFKLVVKSNTDENVYEASDKNTESSDLNDGYSIKQHIGTQINDYTFELETVEDTPFISYGKYKEFVKLWLNGVLLKEGVDYDSEEGSTKITIRSQTLENSTNSDAANTIAMEFRKDDNGDGKGDDGAKMNRTSQNFNVKKETSIDKVIAKIKALPEVSNIKLSDKSIVQSARSVYNALSSSEQANVINRQKLFDLEAQIAKLEEEATNKAAADKVIAKINDIPANITSDAKDEIHAARTAYNALTSAQKKLVTNLDRLEKAEQALSKYEADKAAAQKVVDFITNLPSTLKLEDKDKVNNARTAYNTLTADQKGYVTNYDMLQAAEEEIGKLEAEAREQAKINAAITAIAAIPETVTLNDKATVEAARKAYDALTSVQKDKVINCKDLTDAESAIAALEAQENANKADKAAAEEVINLIDTIPEEVSITDKAKVESIREAYDKLIDNQKKLVTNYGILIDAEATIKAFEDYETAAKKDQAAANEIINLINVIPTDVTLDDKATVEAARKAYNTLTDNQKKIVTNYNTLINAEIKIAELENDNYKEVQSITFVGILLDKDGKALADKIVEIHSVVQTGRTDENGSFQFNSVEFDKHTMFVKDENGDITAQREFNIMLGSPLALNGNEIIAENGSVFTLKMQLNGGELTFLSIENGNKAPVVDTNKNEGIDIGESDKTNTVPDTDVGNNQGNVSRTQTGDNSNLALWYTLLFASLGGLIVTIYFSMRRRKYAGKHQR